MDFEIADAGPFKLPRPFFHWERFGTPIVIFPEFLEPMNILGNVSGGIIFGTSFFHWWAAWFQALSQIRKKRSTPPAVNNRGGSFTVY